MVLFDNFIYERYRRTRVTSVERAFACRHASLPRVGISSNN